MPTVRGTQPTLHKISRYGWIPDLPDKRDVPYATLMKAAPLPASVDLTAKCPPVYDQGQLGSCTANAIGAALEFDQKISPFVPSRLFIYYNERAIEGTVPSDNGAQIRDGIKSVSSQGACDEVLWPYNVSEFAVTPTPPCYAAALKFTATNYYSIDQDLTQMKTCLAEGFPFVFGFTVYDAFESAAVAANGVLDLPGPDEHVIGGHAVLAVGYDEASQRVRVRNSWGAGWGQAGYFTMPYAYITDPNLATDFWTIRLTSE
ncbi:MAG TPA: C1 family peptidase [Candidatus Eremiobacteraceae bacterium]|nr:C1 family peptidase [Candidatus Eremiobacteraceae bacterium]